MGWGGCRSTMRILNDTVIKVIPDREPQCVGRCGMYVERGPPVRVLSGVGLYVEDDDHNEIFYMKVSL